jgi:hypothetical protein
MATGGTVTMEIQRGGRTTARSPSGYLARICESPTHHAFTERLEKENVSCAGRAQLASPHRIVYCYSFILLARTTCRHGDTTYLGLVSRSSPEGLQGGGSTAGRAGRAIDPRNPPDFLAAHCDGAARRTGRCGRGVYRATMSFGIIGGLGEVVEGASCVYSVVASRSSWSTGLPLTYLLRSIMLSSGLTV